MVEPCDVLAVGAHPDDVELGCGATVARLAAAGRRIAILDLTAGEMGTRGDVETRARESRAAATALGAAWRDCLSLPDGGLNGGDDGQVAAVVGALRAAVPRVVLMPDDRDAHPDHAAAAALLRRGAFLAGVGKYRPERGAPWRPNLLLAYPGPRQLPAPALVVDVTAAYAAKRLALAAHASQFEPSAGTATHLASGHFLAAIEGRDRACGNLIGAEFGEGFAAAGALAADELAWLFGGWRPSPDPRPPSPGRAGRGQ
jgi:bacillithiol biosynthesis deacetylase BshB1